MRRSWLSSFIESIADRGRDLLTFRSGGPPVEELFEETRELISRRGEASGTALARDVLQRYQALPGDARFEFLTRLAAELAPDASAIEAAARAYAKQPGAAEYRALAASLDSPRRELLRRLNMAPNGTAALVQMRAELLPELGQRPELSGLDTDLENLFAQWFNRGFLELERIDWRSSALVLEKLIAYEAVHEIGGWPELRRRLERDRRCFAFFHPALPDEPLIFVEVALVSGLADRIDSLIAVDAPVADPASADTAIFYSISNCQSGLKGISFGNFLIKQVVSELSRELPALATFSTLSPIPGFRAWFAEALPAQTLPFSAATVERLIELRDRNEAPPEELREPLLAAAAHYLLLDRQNGRVIDPVARFHLGNGARVERINWHGDLSAKGLAESFGLMANYLYDPAEIEKNHEAFFEQGTVVASRRVRALLP
jgi:malonyl-CoA decarboxylase